MGQCASPASIKKTTHLYDREPVDTQSLKHKQLPRLYFQAILANIKIKKYPYKTATPVFKIREGQSFTLPSKQSHTDDKLMWKIYEKFGFQMTEYELRKQFLQVSIINETSRTVGTVKINLFLITTGPYRQDFVVQFRNGSQGRISFDLKISQVIELKIESEFAELDLIKKHPGEEFSYSIKTITFSNGSSLQSCLSYPAIILLDKMGSETSREFDQISDNVSYEISSPRKKCRSLKHIQEGGNLSWTEDGGTLPFLSTKMIASELSNAYFQILIWKYQISDQQATRELFAHSYVSFYKLFGIEPAIILRGVSQYEQRSITLTEKIQHEGKDYGRGQFKFKITNQPYFRQYQVCVHTEVGILKTNPIFGVQEIKTSEQEQCFELEQILNISASVELNIILMNKLQSEEGPYRQIRRTKSIIELDLQKIFQLVEKSTLPPQMLYKYESESSLIKGQKILVELGMRLTQYFQIQDPSINDLCWLILISLIKRGEFSLSHMGFNDKQKKNIENRNLEGLHEKEEVAIMYKLLLYKLLDLSLNSLRHKGSDHEKTFAEVFSAVAYFRIPEFRKEILRLITKNTDPEISEWRGVEFNLHQDIVEERDIRDNANTFSEVFDWQYHFYKCLRKNDQLESENVNLNDILAQDAWKERFIKRERAFFSFIKYWVGYVDITLQVSKDIHWRYFPGYNRLLKGFFVEMKLRPILEYPDALIQAGLKLLQNQRLLNAFIHILFNKVNAFESSQVLKALQFLNLIFEPLTQKQKTLPISFNYIYFFRGLRIILQGQFSLAISQALTLIYNHFSIFHIEFRRSISMFFMGKMFFPLFLHWSYSVRHVFYHLIIYKIYQCANTGKFRIKDVDILSRYDDITKILAESEDRYHKEKANHFQANLDQQLYKRMRMKIYHRFYKIGNSREQFTHRTKISNLQNSDLFKAEMNGLRRSSRKLHDKLSPPDKENNPQSAKNQQIKRHSQSNQFSYDVYKESDTQSILFQNIIPQKEYQIPNIPHDNLKYLATCLPNFRAIQNSFIDQIERGVQECPIVKQKISIDNREIRPEKIDDW